MSEIVILDAVYNLDIKYLAQILYLFPFQKFLTIFLRMEKSKIFHFQEKEFLVHSLKKIYTLRNNTKFKQINTFTVIQSNRCA